MGINIHGTKKREVDASKQLRRMHKVVPWIESPLQGVDKNHLVFHQRHEANTIELFFDLFFVANLATFTAYHSISDSASLYAYVGFFSILWCSWFQITLHDVRFARDSIYERTCKTIQFIFFVGLALVGSKFQPNGKKGEEFKEDNNTNFRILCYILVMSRALLTLQYIVVLIFTMVAGVKKLIFPLIMNIAVYLAATVVFVGMTPAFKDGAQTNSRIYTVWYIVMLLETFGTIVISCCWTMLSYKKTHLVERMGLLTLIVIGEGAIGVTKTVSRMMGKYGLDPSGTFLVIAIILILVFIWMLYFDNSPHGHYGTIRQQIWSVMHFPLHLSIVGVVEGSQQIALARYVNVQADKLDKAFWQYCVADHLDGVKLVDKLWDKLSYYQFDKKADSAQFLEILSSGLDIVGNATGICSPSNTTQYPQKYAVVTDRYPIDLQYLWLDSISALYASLGVKLPDSYKTTPLVIIMLNAWRVVYAYYWSCVALLIACSLIFEILVRKNKSDISDWVAFIIRTIMLIVSGGLIAVIANDDALYSVLSTPAILPVVLIIFFFILFFDRISQVFANWRLRKSGAAYEKEGEEEHGHEEHGHDEEHGHHGSMDKGANVGILESDPLTASTAYQRPHSIAMTHMVQSPPMHPSPPVTYGSNGYAPVQHYG